MAEDIGLLSVISVPRASWNLLACLADDGVIDNNEKDGLGFDRQVLEKSNQRNLGHFLDGPDVVSQESRKTAQGPANKGMGKRPNHG